MICSELLARLRGRPSRVWLVSRGLTLGRDVYLGTVHFDHGFLGLISIGDESVLTDGVRLVAHDASTKLRIGYTRVGRIDIGRRVYIGVGAIILPDVTIGDGAIVGAGSVVTKDVAPGTLVAGNPAEPRTSVEEFSAKHSVQLRGRPRYPREGFIGPEELAAENVERMRRELSAGHGYIR
jgi:maltose O-acetyltransferase